MVILLNMALICPGVGLIAQFNVFQRLRAKSILRLIVNNFAQSTKVQFMRFCPLVASVSFRMLAD